MAKVTEESIRASIKDVLEDGEQIVACSYGAISKGMNPAFVIALTGALGVLLYKYKAVYYVLTDKNFYIIPLHGLKSTPQKEMKYSLGEITLKKPTRYGMNKMTKTLGLDENWKMQFAYIDGPVKNGKEQNDLIFKTLVK